ncbi:MAG TPA: ParB/RepB/Spo0J family partition protein [Clostridiales bacterium]|nr:ParB/RepB/Spo0J family partition protein [Clostridiales bacterium]
MAKPKRGLGKGLSALIPENQLESIQTQRGKGSIQQVKVESIVPNSNQPRKHFDPEKLDALAESIQKHGIIQPIVICPIEKGYEIIAGERRWRAAKLAGLKEIPCIIKEMDPVKRFEIALIENLQREDLNPIEEAMAYRELIKNYQLTQEEISASVGKSRSYIANSIRLLNLDPAVQEMVIQDQITSGHARALLRIQDPKIQKDVADQIIQNKLSVRETEALVAEMVEGKGKKKKKANTPKKDAYLISIEDSLRAALGTKVNIIRRKKKGKIEIEYYSDEELERLVGMLQGI